VDDQDALHREVSTLDHVRADACGDSDKLTGERGGPAVNEEVPAARLRHVDGGHNHRDARPPCREPTQDVGVEEVTVEDVEALAAKQAEKVPDTEEVAKARHPQAEYGHTQLRELGSQGSRGSQGAHRRAEAGAVKPTDRLQKDTLRATDVKVGDEVEDTRAHGVPRTSAVRLS
jgi:hypothetical protein